MGELSRSSRPWAAPASGAAWTFAYERAPSGSVHDGWGAINRGGRAVPGLPPHPYRPFIKKQPARLINQRAGEAIRRSREFEAGHDVFETGLGEV